MAEDWLADVRKYDADADESVVAAIVRHCGIALRTRDASLVSFSDSKETDRVRNNFLKKKLGLTDDDATLDAAITATGERMKADRTKNRVTVYYLLAHHFDKLTVFGGTARAGDGATTVAATAAAAAAGTMPLAAMSPTPDAAPDAGAPAEPPAAAGNAGMARAAAARKPAPPAEDGLVSFGCLAVAVVLGGFLFAAVLGSTLGGGTDPEEPMATMADAPAAAPAPAPAPSPVPATPAAPVPEGAGVVAAERDSRPMLTVYFDSGSADVTPDFANVAAPLLAYLAENPEATVAISGYNDPTGNAEINAALSRTRAQNVQASLVAAGLAEPRTDLVRPENTTTTELTPAEARRVEVTVVGE